MLTLDLPPVIEQRIMRDANAQNISVTDYILQHLSQATHENLSWYYGKDVFGKYAESEDGTLSQNVKALVAEQVKLYDYTKWRHTMLNDVSLDDISEMAMQHRRQSK